MFRKYWYIFLIILSLVGVILFFIFKEPPTKQQFTFPTTIKIVNTTLYKGVDTMLYIGLFHVLKVDSIQLNVLSNSTLFHKRYEDRAILQKNINFYNLFLDSDISESELPLIISHELVHLKQHLTNNYIVYGDSIFYNGQMYSKNLEYSLRPWEIEAFRNQDIIRTKINKIWYEEEN